MNKFPSIHTERLTLNRLKLSDVDVITEHCSNTNVSEFLVNMPEPYHKEDAFGWVKNSWKNFEEGKTCVFAIRDKETEMIMGGIGLIIDQTSQKSNIGYWLGEQYWNKGYMTEALKAVLKFGFDHLKLNKMYASHFMTNESSGIVMRKAGMLFEAKLIKEFYRRDQFHDIKRYCILKEQFLTANKAKL